MKGFSKNKKQVISLFVASIIGMLFGIINSAVNTNYLSPELYGNVRYVQNIINFFSSILLLGFFVSGSRLLALSDNEEKSRHIRGGMVFILAVTQIILMLIMGCFAIYSGIQHNFEMKVLYVVAIPTCGNVILLNYINTTAQGDNHINRISLARILPPLLYFLLALPIFYNLGASSVLMLVLFNGSAVLILSIIIISTRPKFKDLRKSLKNLVIENKKYGFHVYLGSIAGVSTSYIAGITLGYFCANNSDVGFYTLALTLASPLTLLPSIVGTTYFKKFSCQSKIDKKVFYSTIVLSVVSLLIYIILIKYIVAFIYPGSYSVVSELSSWLALSTTFYGFGDVINRFLGSHGQGKQIRNSSYTCGLITLVGSIMFVYFWGVYGAVVTRILGALAYMIMLIYYYKKFVSDENTEKYE